MLQQIRTAFVDKLIGVVLHNFLFVVVLDFAFPV